MDNAVEYILTHYQLPKYKNDPMSRAVLKALINALKPKELKVLQKRLKRGSSRWQTGSELYREAEKVMSRQKTIKNEPVARLLKQFTDKRRGKVVDSRAKLKDRFAHQDFGMQRKILKVFLMGAKIDRLWAYKQLRGNWDDFFTDDIKALWEKHHEQECERLVIQFLPTEYILDNITLLNKDGNYSWLCIRLIQHPQFQVDKARLTEVVKNGHFIFSYKEDIEYLYILAKSHSKIENGEATRILFEHIAKEIKNNSYSSYYPITRAPASDKFGEIGIYDDFFPSTKWMSDVSRILWCMGQLGLIEELISFEEWDKMVQQRFKTAFERQESWLEPFDPDKNFKLFREVVAECIPYEYKYLIHFPFNTHNHFDDTNQKVSEVDLKQNPAIITLIDEYDLKVVKSSKKDY